MSTEAFLTTEFEEEYLEQQPEPNCLAEKEDQLFRGPRRVAEISPSDVVREAHPPIGSIIRCVQGSWRISTGVSAFESIQLPAFDEFVQFVRKHRRPQDQHGLEVDGEMIFSLESSSEETFRKIRQYIDQADHLDQAPVFFRIWTEAIDFMKERMQELALHHLIEWKSDVMEGRIAEDGNSFKKSFFFVVVPEPPAPSNKKDANRPFSEEEQAELRRYLDGDSSL